MKKSKLASLLIGAALLALVGVFAYAAAAVIESKTLTWKWTSEGDQKDKGTSTIAVTEGKEGSLPAWTIKGELRVGWQYCAAYATATPDAATLEKLKTSTGIAFKVLGDGDRYKIKMLTSDVKDGGYFEYFFETVKSQAITVVVPIEFFLKPSWTQAGPTRLNMNNVTDVGFETARPGTAGPFEFKVWDMRLYTGGVPALSASEKKDNDNAIKAAAAAAAKIAKPVGGNLGAQSATLIDNFQYGGCWQGLFIEPVLFNGNKISKGETYTLEITYTTDRDIGASMWVGLVDPSPSAGNWKPLSWSSSKDLKVAGQELPASKKGEVVSKTLTFTTVNGATGVRANQNALVFAVADEKKNGPVTLKFTKFVFTKK